MDTKNKGCPTAILIDVSPPCGSSSLNNHVSNSTLFFKENEMSGCKFLNQGKKLDRRSNYVNDCKTGDSPNSSNSSEIQSQISIKRLRWKTPSPQSMSRISKEASKIIENLNSSIFDEDLLLTEEILPVTLNFDELDDDDTDQNSCDNVFEDAVLDYESSVKEKLELQSKIENIDKKLNYLSSLGVSEKIKDNLKSSHEANISEQSFQVSSKNNSKQSYSSGVHGSSFINSSSLTHSDEADAFNMKYDDSEDKENVQNKKNKLISSKENKTATKNLLLNKSKLDQRGTLRNLSNITQVASAEHLSISKNMATPLKKMSISVNKKITASHVEKPQAKKTTLSVDHPYSFSSFPQSKSIHFNTKKELISSTLKPQSTANIGSGCRSSSSDVKQQNIFATSSKRYSICTPLKSSSAVKPPLTPLLTSSHNFVFPRYTPQPAKPSRLSFSKSWQQSHNTSQFFPARGIKLQSSVAEPSTLSKNKSGIKKSSKPGKLSFSQSMSSAPIRSSGTKGRFSSKLLSPLSVEQDKKIARALFTSVNEK